MNNTDTGNTAKLLGAALIGAAIGAGLGLLFAPEGVSETRKKFVDEIKELAGKFTLRSHCPNCNCNKETEEEPAKAV